MSEPQNNQPVFSIEKVYVKDLSLEIPNAPQVFLEREAPNVDIQLHHNSNGVEDGVFETVLTVTVTAKAADKTMFLVEVSQAGIFVARNIPAQELEQVLGIACPNILFPYVREVISDTVVRAGFPPVILSPVNFEAIYQSTRQQQPAAGSEPRCRSSLRPFRTEHEMSARRALAAIVAASPLLAERQSSARWVTNPQSCTTRHRSRPTACSSRAASTPSKCW
jgi:preprotein translocase subunit SecB